MFDAAVHLQAFISAEPFSCCLKYGLEISFITLGDRKAGEALLHFRPKKFVLFPGARRHVEGDQFQEEPRIIDRNVNSHFG